MRDMSKNEIAYDVILVQTMEAEKKILILFGISMKKYSIELMLKVLKI